MCDLLEYVRRFWISYFWLHHGFIVVLKVLHLFYWKRAGVLNSDFFAWCVPNTMAVFCHLLTLSLHFINDHYADFVMAICLNINPQDLIDARNEKLSQLFMLSTN